MRLNLIKNKHKFDDFEAEFNKKNESGGQEMLCRPMLLLFL